MPISEELKRNCVELYKSGKTMREVYDELFSKEHSGMSYQVFRHKLRNWKKRQFADPDTLEKGTYEGFTAHGATVQVNGNGEIVQVWVKQHAEENWLDQIIESIEANVTPVMVRPETMPEPVPEMLEIPLFDQHFPQNDGLDVFGELSEIISSRQWEEINFIVGQDLFHNDDFRGRTSSGRPIEQVDMVKAWEMAKAFYYHIISWALAHAQKVKVIYSKGNHDESMAWAFIQMLKAMFPEAEFDDSLKQRKCISWRECFIGITHGAYKKSTMTDLRGQFTIQFATEFASAKVREIHAGHLRREEERDIYGVMCRRLAHKGMEDDWTDDEGYVGANKRFMVFRWKPGRLAGIDYI